jgi:hypothetical protein
LASPRLASPLHFSNRATVAVRASFKIDPSFEIAKGLVNESASNGAVFTRILLLYEHALLFGTFFIQSHVSTNKTQVKSLSVTDDLIDRRD